METFPEEKEKAVCGDTFAVHANATAKCVPVLLRDTCGVILDHIKKCDEALLAKIVVNLDLNILLGGENEKPVEWLEKAERQELAVKIAKECLRFKDILSQNGELLGELGSKTADFLNEKLAHLNKILNNEFKISSEHDAVKISLVTKHKKGSYRIACVVGHVATYRVHGDKMDFGYNPNVITTDNFVWAIYNQTGCTPDPVSLPDMMQQFHQDYDFFPSKLIYDRAAGTGKWVAKIKEATDGVTRLSVRLIGYSKQPDRYRPQDFTLSEDGSTLTCPAGKSTTRKYLYHNGEGHLFRFPPSLCADCNKAKDCRGKGKSTKTRRDVFISFYYFDVKETLAYSKTDEFKNDIKFRSQVERVIAGLVLHNGARRAYSRGLKKVDYQLKMNAVAYNAKRWALCRPQ